MEDENKRILWICDDRWQKKCKLVYKTDTKRKKIEVMSHEL